MLSVVKLEQTICPQGLLEHPVRRQAKLDRQIGIDSLTIMSHLRWRRPKSKRVFTDPVRQVTASPQAMVVLGPFGHEMLLLRVLVTTSCVELVRHLQHPRENMLQLLLAEQDSLHVADRL